MKLIGMIADHPTPKISGGGIAYTLNSRDYKGVMIVVAVEQKNVTHKERVYELSESNRAVDGK